MTSYSPTALARGIREAVIEQSYRAHVGHIGSSLSIADLLAALYTRAPADTAGDPGERDRVVLSKGHAALALYAALELTGALAAGSIDEYCVENTQLGVHPEHAVDGVDFSTGSLGHGLSLACGAALAARMQGSSRRAFVVMSDAELNEGSVWEAAMFAAHHRLANLSERWAAFGWDVHTVDGHDPVALVQLLNSLSTVDGEPHMLLANTVFGKGVSFMENRIEWHYLPLSDTDYARALEELAAAREATVAET